MLGRMSVRKLFAFGSVAVLATALTAAALWRPAAWTLGVVVPLFVLGWSDFLQRRHTIMRNFPLVGRGRYWMEVLRPKIYQYFVESDYSAPRNSDSVLRWIMGLKTGNIIHGNKKEVPHRRV